VAEILRDARDTATDSRPAFVVDDGDYVSARWPGDTHTFATVVSRELNSAHQGFHCRVTVP
jgi:hypothetical protein